MGSPLCTARAPSLPASLSIVMMTAADKSSSSASDDDTADSSSSSASDDDTSSLISTCFASDDDTSNLISTCLKYTAEHKKNVVAAVGMELNECPLYTLEAGQDLNSFCATSVGIALADLKYGSPKAIEGFAQALVENIWSLHGKDIAAAPARWLVCGPAYRFVPKSAVLMSRRVHELLADRCVAEGPANQVPELLELYRGSFRGGGDQEYASLGRECREKMMPSFTVRATPVAPGVLGGKRVVAIDDTRIYGVHAKRTEEALRALGCTAIYHFFALVPSQALLERWCAGSGSEGQEGVTMQVEDRLNRAVVCPADDADMFCGWSHLQSILLEDGFAWTMRTLTFLMRRPTAHLAVVLGFLGENQPRLLGELFAAVHAESLHEKNPEGAALLGAAALTAAARQ